MIIRRAGTGYNFPSYFYGILRGGETFLVY